MKKTALAAALLLACQFVARADRSTPLLDLSAIGHVQAGVTNTGAVPVAFNLRLDNDGDWKEWPRGGAAS